MTRAEHVRWCKQRAKEYLPGDPKEALTSMMSDLEKHPDTAGLASSLGMLFLFEMQKNSAVSAQKFIDGFAE